MLIPYLLIGILLLTISTIIFKNKTDRFKRIFLLSLWILGVLLLFINKAWHYARGEHILAQLPLHLCYVSLIFFLPLSLLTKNKTVCDFAFYINVPGAFMALIFPAKDYVDGMFSVITLTYFAFHWIIVCIPLLLFFWKLYQPKTSLNGAIKIILILLFLSLAMHGLNLVLVKNGVENANYFWTLIDNARHNEVSILELFASIIPIDYLYLVAFAAPILIIYISLWNIALRRVC